MNLIESTVNVDSGLSWEQNLNSSLTRIDGHDHSSGNGVQIQPTGLNINANLSFGDNAGINLSAIVFTPQVSFATLSAVYSQGVDLYFNDGSGNIIQITSGGNVNATSSGISSGSNTASFVSNVLVVQSAVDTSADIDVGSIILRNDTALSKGLTLSPPTAMAANYSLTLPSLPASTLAQTLDSSGNMGTSLVTTALIGPAAVTLAKMAANSVDTSQLVDGSVTITKQPAMTAGTTAPTGGIAVSASSGSYLNSTPTYTSVCSCTLNTSGRPVQILLVADVPVGPQSHIGTSATSAGQVASLAQFKLLRSTTPIAEVGLFIQQSAAGGSGILISQVPPGTISHIDINPGLGTYVYELQATGAVGQAQVNFCHLIAYEI